MSNVQMPFKLVNYRHLKSKTGRDWTVVEGVVELGDGKSSICETMLEGTHHFVANPAGYVLHLNVGVNRDRRIEIRAEKLVPAQAVKAAV